MFCKVIRIRSENKWAIVFYDHEFQRTDRPADRWWPHTQAHLAAHLLENTGISAPSWGWRGGEGRPTGLLSHVTGEERGPVPVRDQLFLADDARGGGGNRER